MIPLLVSFFSKCKMRSLAKNEERKTFEEKERAVRFISKIQLKMLHNIGLPTWNFIKWHHLSSCRILPSSNFQLLRSQE